MGARGWVRALLAGLGAATVLCALPSPTWAQPASSAPDPERVFQRGRNAFQYGDYDQATTLLQGLLSPKVLLSRSEDVHEALELLGVAGHMRGDLDTARAAFVRLLTMDPEARLDPLVVPPQVVEFFDSLRSELAAKLERYRLQQELQRRTQEMEAQQAGPRRLVVEQITIDRHPYWVNFVPFGAGQFQLGRTGWGIFFLAGESLALGANLGSALVVEASRNPDGTHAPEDFRRARDLFQPLQLATLLAFGVLAGWGVVDALAHWEPHDKRVRRWEEDLPEEPEEPPDPHELDGPGTGSPAHESPREPAPTELLLPTPAAREDAPLAPPPAPPPR